MTQHWMWRQQPAQTHRLAPTAVHTPIPEQTHTSKGSQAFSVHRIFSVSVIFHSAHRLKKYLMEIDTEIWNKNLIPNAGI